jgi:hypothetical protein
LLVLSRVVTVDPAIRAIAMLADELRRDMDNFTGRPPAGHPCRGRYGRRSRKLAAFLLDKLVDPRVLRAETGRSQARARSAGYQPIDTDIRISFPPRQHHLLADILLDAVFADGDHHGEQDPDRNARHAALRVVRERGHAIGATDREQSRPGAAGRRTRPHPGQRVLHRHGFEPGRTSPACLRLRTRPFHPLASTAPRMVCGLNHALLAGFSTGSTPAAQPGPARPVERPSRRRLALLGAVLCLSADAPHDREDHRADEQDDAQHQAGHD